LDGTEGEIHLLEIAYGNTLADRRMPLALFDMAQQCDHRAALGLGQRGQRLFLPRRLLSRPTRMAPFIHSGQSKLVPALSPLPRCSNAP
jgi:hypothetical protein